jgi:hypothetical protein
LLGQFAPAQLQIFNFFLNGELERLEVSALVTTIAPRLLQTLPTAAPPVGFIVNFRVLYSHRPRHWRYRSNCLISPLSIVGLLDISVDLHVKMAEIQLLSALGCIRRSNDPSLRFHVLYFFEEMPQSTHQHCDYNSG